MSFLIHYLVGSSTSPANETTEPEQRVLGVTQSPTPILPPWEVDIPPQWVGRENELEMFIRRLSASEYTFCLPQSELVVDGDDLFHFDLSDDHDFYSASLLLTLDLRLSYFRGVLVDTGVVNEDTFWSSYFYFIYIIKHTKEIHVLPRMIRELHQRAAMFYKDSNFEKELEREVKWWFQAVEQCMAMLDFLLLHMCDEVSLFDQKHMQYCYTECLEREKRVSSLLADYSESEEMKTNAIKDILERKEQVAESFHALTIRHEEYKKRTNPQSFEAFTPQLIDTTRNPPSVTTVSQRTQICAALPVRFHRCHWTLVYSTLEHGVSISTLLRFAEQVDEALLVIQTTKGAIFGAYIGSRLTRSTKFYGTGETLLFSFANVDRKGNPLFQVFTWTKANEYFVRSSEHDGIVFGGGTDGKAGLFIDPSLEFGTSHASMTFNNVCLNRDPSRDSLSPAHEDDEDFRIFAVEVWGFGTAEMVQQAMLNGPTPVLLRFSF